MLLFFKTAAAIVALSSIMFFAGWAFSGKLSGGWWLWKRWWLCMGIIAIPAAMVGLVYLTNRY
jgi:hypothetical protein